MWSATIGSSPPIWENVVVLLEDVATAVEPTNADAAETLLDVQGLTTAYRGLIAISNISIDVRPGEIVTVAGANGAGTSTLLKSIAGLERARAGTVIFAGKRIEAMPGHQITARGLAYVPENKRLFPRLTVADNLRLGSYLHRARPDRDRPLEIVFSLFPRLKERLGQAAGTLSGGEQQMLAIGRALMTRPRLLMLDEPSQGIMPKLVDEIFDAVQSIRDTGVTVLLVEQRLAESLEIADRAYVLQTGRLILSGTATEVQENPEVRRAYLGI
jgi:branched-chain amino acid transport system ATP-binding protein